MTNETLIPDHDHVNASVDQVSAWADRAGERGLMNPTTARLKVTALRRITSVLADDEGMGVQEILTNLDALAVRFARKEGGNPDTLGTYKQRAESILRDFIDYHRDPFAFQSRIVERSAKAAAKPHEKKKVEGGEDRTLARSEPSSTSAGAALSVSGRSFAFPLGSDREFSYIIPVDGIKMSEVMRISFHLASMAIDFDPTAKDVTEMTRRVRNVPDDERRD